MKLHLKCFFGFHKYGNWYSSYTQFNNKQIVNFYCSKCGKSEFKGSKTHELIRNPQTGNSSLGVVMPSTPTVYLMDIDGEPTGDMFGCVWRSMRNELRVATKANDFFKGRD